MEDEENQKKIFELGMMENRLKQLDQQLSLVDNQILEDKNLEKNIEEMGKNGKSDAVFPFGGGIFLHGSLNKIESVLVNVGSGVIIEKNLESVLKFLQKRIRRMNEAKEELGNQVKEIVSVISGIEHSVQRNG